MDPSKFNQSSNLFHNKHNMNEFSVLFNSALNKPELLEDDEESNTNRTSGRWSKEEHHRFIEGLTKYGKNWKKVEEHIGTRTGAQIRSHAQKFFIRLTKEFKKRVQKEDNLGICGEFQIDDKKTENRQRSNSMISNFSNFSLDNISENEEDEKVTHEKKLVKEPKLDNNNQEKHENNHKINENSHQEKPNEKFIEKPNEKFIEKYNEKFDENIEKPPGNLGLERFLSNVSEKQEDVKNKLMKSQENNEVLKIPSYEKQLNHYQGVIKFFQGLHSYYESGTSSPNPPQQGFLEANEIKQNQSFFDFILRNLEKYVNKAHNIIDMKGSPPIRIRKLSDLVIMPMEENTLNKGQFIQQNEKKSPKKLLFPNDMPRMRKGSFNLCNENEIDNKKLENLKRKTLIKDVVEKKQKI